MSDNTRDYSAEFGMTQAEARALVVADQRETEWETPMTDDDLIAHVRNTVTLPGVYVSGGWPVDDDGSDLSHAYIIIVSTDN